MLNLAGIFLREGVLPRLELLFNTAWTHRILKHLLTTFGYLLFVEHRKPGFFEQFIIQVMHFVAQMMGERTFLFELAARGHCFLWVKTAAERLRYFLWFSVVVVDASLVFLYSACLDLVVFVEGETFAMCFGVAGRQKVFGVVSVFAFDRRLYHEGNNFIRECCLDSPGV